MLEKGIRGLGFSGRGLRVLELVLRLMDKILHDP